MNKKMIALAIAAAMPMAAATAAPTVYGVAQVEYADSDLTGTNMTDKGGARIGIKGSEDLGNGLSAVYQMEYDIEMSDTGLEANGGRMGLVGLKGSFGQVSIGRHASAFASVGLDSVRGTIAQARGVSQEMGSEGGFANGSFLSDTVAYKGKFGNVTVHGTLSMNDAPATDGDSSFAVDFKQGDLRVVAAVSSNDSATTTTDYSKFGAQYKLGAWKFTAQMENKDTGSAETDYTMIGADFTMGKNMIVARVGNAETDTTDYDGSTVALVHNFSKTTKAYIGVNSDDDPAIGDSTGFGMMIKF